jgi:hypothetical protein
MDQDLTDRAVDQDHESASDCLGIERLAMALDVGDEVPGGARRMGGDLFGALAR